MKDQIEVVVADESHEKYVDTILETISEAAKVRGTGIAKRTHEYVLNKMREAKAVIALDGDRFAGFSYIETWQDKKYVTTSGLIVHPDYRGRGLAKRIKDMGQTYQGHDIHTGPYPLAARQNILAYKRCCGNGHEHPTGLQARHVCRPYPG